MNLVDLIALLALLQFFYFSVLVGRARGQYQVKAPAVTGHEMFERAYRIQMNTLEMLVLFLPALYLCARYWPPVMAVVIGIIYLLGRFIYQRAYLADPASRSLGFGLSVGPALLLLLGALAGVIRSLF